MKSILLSIRPEWVAKILNGEKTIEIRKKFPKDYVGWVYIYCTKGKPLIYYVDDEVGCVEKVNGEFAFRTSKNPPALNGKVCCRFWCDKVEDILWFYGYKTLTLLVNELEDKSCLNQTELNKYLQFNNGYAIHISKLEVFEKPKELYEFMTPKSYSHYQKELNKAYESDEEIAERIASGDAFDDECANAVELTEMAKGYYGLTKAPQNYCYIESEELEK